MEQLLFLLFLVFSVGSALLERRKRARQLEEAQKRADERRQRQSMDGEPVVTPVAVEEEDDDEEWGGWPFPGGGDPFDQPRPRTEPARPVRSSAPAPLEVEADETSEEVRAPVADVRSLLEEIDRRSHQAEQRAREEEERAMRRAEEARQAVRPRKPIGELMQRQLAETMPEPQTGKLRRRVSPWRLTPDTARKAVVYAEILGPCKAARDDSQERWSS